MFWWLLACVSDPITSEKEVQDIERKPILAEKKSPSSKHQSLPENKSARRSQGPPPNQEGGGSGAKMQDPSGFPIFHDWPAPKGKPIVELGEWSQPLKLTKKPSGGYRPQIAISRDDLIHVVYYTREKEGDIIHHRMSRNRQKWSPTQQLGHSSARNWGPDLITKKDGTAIVVYDHMVSDFRSRGYLTSFDDFRGVWSAPVALTENDGGEVGSGHIAASGELEQELAYVFIGKELGVENHFQARWRWFDGDKWSNIKSFSDGKQDAWHTNVERRPDGSVVVGFDVGTGGAETTLFFAEGEKGTFGALHNLTTTGKPGERPHFAFFDDYDFVTWFHKEQGKPKHVYVRAHDRKNDHWGGVEEPSLGYGGFHFDPEIAVNQEGTLCLVWGWDQGASAEMVYSIKKDNIWSKPKKLADIRWGKPGLASIDVDADGRFHVVWNQGVRGYNEVYYAYLEVK